jgi:chromosome partitioning protein
LAKTIALANQKGGVAKTTSAISIGVALSEHDKKVLLVDLDPQGSLSFSVGLDPEMLQLTLHDVMANRVEIQKVIKKVRHVDIVPASIDLAGAEVTLLARTGREHVLKRALSEIRALYDYILIDCPPSLGLLTINGLTAADEVIIPVACEALSHRGVGQLLETVEDVKVYANPSLKVKGMIITLYDDRTRHAKEVLEDLPKTYKIPVLEPPVKKSIRFAEAPSLGESILDYAPDSSGAQAYREIARQLLL